MAGSKSGHGSGSQNHTMRFNKQQCPREKRLWTGSVEAVGSRATQSRLDHLGQSMKWNLRRPNGSGCRLAAGCYPVSECLKTRPKVKGGRQRHEARCLRPTRPRAVFMLLIVRAPIERLAIAVGASEIDRQRSAGLSIVLMEGPKIVFPFSIALRFVPARKQVTNVHCSTLYDRHPGERTDLPASECPVDERRGSPGSF
jgi:hypothetical protein